MIIFPSYTDGMECSEYYSILLESKLLRQQRYDCSVHLV